MISLISLNGNTVQVVDTPASPAPASVEFSVSDAVAIQSSPFTGQTQVQAWPGADMWTGTITLPPLTQAQADEWIAFLMQLRGMQNAFQIGDPLKANPRGTGMQGRIVEVDGTQTMTPGGILLYTKGWPPSQYGVLLRGDYIQLSVRLYRVLDDVVTDFNGNSVITVWPSLREVPPDSTPLVISNTTGLFRLSTNKRTWSTDVTRLTRMSFQIQEYR